MKYHEFRPTGRRHFHKVSSRLLNNKRVLAANMMLGEIAFIYISVMFRLSGNSRVLPPFFSNELIHPHVA